MRALAFLALALAMLVFAPGCISIETAHDGGADMVFIENEGCFLFGCIPLMTGDPKYPNQDVCVIFKNTQTLDTNMQMLEEEARRQGATGVRNISSKWVDDPIIYILLKRKVLQTSAELTR